MKTKKIIIILSIFFLNILLNFYFVNAENNSLYINGTDIIAIGETVPFVARLDLIINPIDDEIDNQEMVSDNVSSEVMWSSSNQKIAIVDNNGNVTGISEGNVVITAIYDGENKATYNVKVKFIEQEEEIKVENDEFVEGNPMSSTYYANENDVKRRK